MAAAGFTIEGIIQRIRNAPAGASLADVVKALTRDGIPEDLVFLCYKAAGILDMDVAEAEIRRTLGLADTDPPPPTTTTITGKKT